MDNYESRENNLKEATQDREQKRRRADDERREPRELREECQKWNSQMTTLLNTLVGTLEECISEGQVFLNKDIYFFSDMDASTDRLCRHVDSMGRVAQEFRDLERIHKRLQGLKGLLDEHKSDVSRL